MNLHLEQSALADMLAGHVSDIPKKCIPEDFSNKEFREVFCVCRDDYLKHGACDFNRVNARLLLQEWYLRRGGAAWLVTQINRVHMPYTPSFQIAELLREELVRRKAKQFQVSHGKAQEMIDEIASKASELSDMIQSDHRTLDDILEEVKQGTTRFVSTGITSFDHMVTLEKGNLVVVGARTGCGKTTVLCNIACNLAVENVKTLFCTKEMPSSEIIRRFIVYLSGGENPATAVDEYRDTLETFLKVNDSVSTILDIERAVIGSDADVVFIDYIQRLSSDKNFRENRVSELNDIVQRLKDLAQQTGKVVIAASQLNRERDKTTRPPVLKDLSGCGGIENDANAVLLLYDPEQADDSIRDWMGESDPTIQFMVAKNRNGPCGQFQMQWKKQQFTFLPLAP